MRVVQDTQQACGVWILLSALIVRRDADDRAGAVGCQPAGHDSGEGGQGSDPDGWREPVWEACLA